MNPSKVIVMGVSGSGKSLVGSRLSRRLGMTFYDADDFHSAANIDKMSRGVPLSDADRQGWLDDLTALIQREPGLVLACSALKKAYRDQLRAASPDLLFVYLKGDLDTIWSRHARREDHYFNGRAMLESQFDQLEPPGEDEAFIVDVHQSPEAVLAHILGLLNR